MAKQEQVPKSEAEPMSELTNAELERQIDVTDLRVGMLVEEMKLREDKVPHSNIEAISALTDEQLEKDAGASALKLWRLQWEKGAR